MKENWALFSWHAFYQDSLGNIPSIGNGKVLWDSEILAQAKSPGIAHTKLPKWSLWDFIDVRPTAEGNVLNVEQGDLVFLNFLTQNYDIQYDW